MPTVPPVTLGFNHVADHVSCLRGPIMHQSTKFQQNCAVCSWAIGISNFSTVRHLGFHHKWISTILWPPWTQSKPTYSQLSTIKQSAAQLLQFKDIQFRRCPPSWIWPEPEVDFTILWPTGTEHGPGCRISTQSGNPRQSYWWSTKFSQPIFQGEILYILLGNEWREQH